MELTIREVETTLAQVISDEVTPNIWSFARQQKYDFCPRAFYFSYKEISTELSSDLRREVRQTREKAQYRSQNEMFVLALRSVFYDRSLSHADLRKQLLKDGHRYGVGEQGIFEAGLRIKEFKNSSFYLETAPGLVHHLPTHRVESVEIGSVTVFGQVHFAWSDKRGKNYFVNFHQEVPEQVNLSFPVLYALRKFSVDPTNLNIGIVDRESICHWYEIDWQQVQEIQDKALSFPFSGSLEEYPETDDKRRCQGCNFQSICQGFYAELDLYR